MTSHRRRPTGILLAGVLGVVAVAALIARQGAEPTVTDELRQRLERAEEPARFSLDHQRGGTRVLDCMLPNTRFSIDVDTAAGTMAVRRENGDLIALVDPARLLLARGLFRDPPFTAPWLAVPRDASASSLAGVRRVLGADLAGYLLGAQLPATARATAIAALDAAASVERIDPLRESDERADGYRLRIDPDRFAAATLPDAATSTSPSAAAPAPLIELWVTTRGNVARISIRPQTSDGDAGPAEDGWIVDYGPPPADRAPRPGRAETTPIAQVDAFALAPAAVGCQLGG